MHTIKTNNMKEEKERKRKEQNGIVVEKHNQNMGKKLSFLVDKIDGE